MATPETEAGSRPLAQAARAWLGDALELAHVRLALLGVEASEHALDLARGLAWMMAAALLLPAALVCLLVLLTVLLWDTQRVLALALASGVLMATGAAAAWVGWQRLRGVAWFAASRAELARDVERLRGGRDAASQG
ncbi:putative Actinobacterial Holin-X, holin superfamily III [Tepidimonas alkaliphilus]|uniref:Putative Actinobacterial Holin-X, holin superfamily III n=1 Tax=Tepidimonas alkaliphilus TaxID=2588942 RepID=A0A554WB46_9BURK|nr:phage holin family protein [Tepidimonas alkaliphilus]TSE20789.1 putative Actinobacterial Holin-X, holin superfamily III [Tepidimonas alkaliphilus]